MNIPDDLLYTKEHEWIKIEGNKGAVGITDYAQSHLGDVTYVELPEKGKSVKQSEALAAIDSVKAASDIYAPMSGTVSEVNEGLESAPESVNKDPYGAGWIAKIDIKDAEEKKNLMDSKAYKQYLESIKE
ncbi:MAG: glycine cleavage system protein GcvH [Candidatus Omnitrophica bacterium]|nr:glycine cleavage system protein GcvH [Candidatus Omnitrophota bacterium]MBU4488554.1 glycine cleavage system protein GcvH [Candidatus Omnitrophota bacterium]MCG2705429.1 glycine cleavage system protein GcvH [Candidatus Omnitrophota bacterium]